MSNLIQIVLIGLFLSSSLSSYLSSPRTLSDVQNSYLNYNTASAEFSYLLTCPCFPRFYSFVRFKSILSKRRSYNFLLLLILLSGDIELNPGPSQTPTNPITSSFSLCTLNIRSLANEDHLLHLHDIADTNKFHCFAITETWLSSTTTPAEYLSIPPPEYELVCANWDSNLPNVRRGGVGFLIRKPCTLLSSNPFTFSSFEALTVRLQIGTNKLSLLNIYRPPDSSNYAQPFSTFIDEFRTLLASFSTTKDDFLITGDFNIHVDNFSDSHSSQLSSLLSSMNLKQHISFPTHSGGHTLDLVITSDDSNIISSTASLPISPSDHLPIVTTCSLSIPIVPTPSLVTFRKFSLIDINQFKDDIMNSPLIKDPPSSLTELVQVYNSTLTNIINKHAPLITRPQRNQSNPWYNQTLRSLKSGCRRAERIWAKTRSSVSKLILHHQVKIYHSAIKHAKQAYYANIIDKSSKNTKSLWKTVNTLLHKKTTATLPSTSPSALPSVFSTFFADKIIKLRSAIQGSRSSRTPDLPQPLSKPKDLKSFDPCTIDEIRKLIIDSPDKHCQLDPIPTFLLKQCIDVLAPVITRIVNLSLLSSSFPDDFKQAIVTPLLKKPTLDKEELSNYRPISNLSFLSKLTERLIKNRLTSHLSSNSLFNIHQSAYTRHHSTETVLLSVHDFIIRAMSTQKLTCLCLLDLSAAFDTIDHSILIERLQSWFGIQDKALSWFKSYLHNRKFSVNVGNSLSPPVDLSYGVPQGSVLGPILFALYTTPLSSLISSQSLQHHLFADDTQLFASFSPSSFSQTAESLQTIFDSISSWMSANFLALNPSKTEFMIFGNAHQLSKLQNPILTLDSATIIHPATTARNLGFIFDKHLSLHDHISSLSKACFFHIRDLRRIRPCLNHRTASIIATSLVHSKLDYCNSLFVNLPSQELDRLQFIQNSLARAVSRSSRFSHVTPTLKSLHWLKIRERVLYKTISLTYKTIQADQPLYLSNLLTFQQQRSTRSSQLVTLARPSNPSHCQITDRSFYFNAPKIWNSLPASLRSPKISDESSSRPRLSLTHQQFHSQLKTHLFAHSYPPSDSVPRTRPARKPPQ